MHRLIEKAFENKSQSTKPFRNDEIWVLSCSAPVANLEALFLLEQFGDHLLWDPDTTKLGEPGWSFVGLGITERFEGTGNHSLEEIQKKIMQTLGALQHYREPQCRDFPEPRVYGGIAFSPQKSNDTSPWKFFADISFVLPRWEYGFHKEHAFLRLAIHPEELEKPQQLQQEFQSILEQLTTPVLPVSVKEKSFELSQEEMNIDEWSHTIRHALLQIDSGSFEKVVAARVSQMTQKDSIDIAQTIKRLRTTQPSTIRFSFQRKQTTFLGATPERLFYYDGTHVFTDAIAGSTAQSSVEQASQILLADEKERREHDNVISGIYQALASVCLSLEIPKVPSILSLGYIQHLWTPILGTLSKKMYALEILKKLHPTPAVCGLPTKAAANWIATHEKEPRGWYAAPVGWLDAKGRGAFAVAIRSALLQGSKAWLYAGAGIVKGSQPAKEYHETSIKQKAMKCVLGAL